MKMDGLAKHSITGILSVFGAALDYAVEPLDTVTSEGSNSWPALLYSLIALASAASASFLVLKQKIYISSAEMNLLESTTKENIYLRIFNYLHFIC